MTAEAGAAVHGTFDGGAIDVLVNDSHGGFRNLIPDSIDRHARFVLGKLRHLNTMAGVGDCDAVRMIGCRARADSRGVLTHTINSFALARVWFNERELGEADLYGALTGECGVPVVVAGDGDVLIKETKPLLPHIMFIKTKQVGGQNAGTSPSSEQSCEAIYTAIKATARHGHFGTPLCLQTLTVCRLQTQTPALANLSYQWPALEHVDGMMLRSAAGPVEHAVRMFDSLSATSVMSC